MPGWDPLPYSVEEANAVGAHAAGIADLAAGFSVERRLVQHDRAGLALLQLGDLLAVAHQGGNDAFGLLGFVAEEFGRADALAHAEPHRFLRGIAGSGPGSPRFFALAVHRIREGGEIDANTTIAQRILREVERKAVSIIERDAL